MTVVRNASANSGVCQDSVRVTRRGNAAFLRFPNTPAAPGVRTANAATAPAHIDRGNRLFYNLFIEADRSAVRHETRGGYAVKIGLFADAHYSSQERTCGVRRNNLSLRKLRDACAYFVQQGCDLVVSLGDLIDKNDSRAEDVRRLEEVRGVIAGSGVETVCVMGNHDAFTFRKDEYYRILGGCEPADRTVDGVRLIFADTCFFTNGERYTPAGGDWKDCFLPEESAFLDRLSSSDAPVLVFLHHNVDPAVPESHRLANADALFRGIRDAGCVRAVFQGHYHPGLRSRYGDVRYVTLPAVCENENAFFVIDTNEL